jgi:molybdopterin adenylyltransferase
VINLPGKPSSIRMTLLAVFPAVPYCLDLIGASRIETNPDLVQAFRPA